MTDWELESKKAGYEVYSHKVKQRTTSYLKLSLRTGNVYIYTKAKNRNGFSYHLPATELSPEDIEFIAQKTKELLNA